MTLNLDDLAVTTFMTTDPGLLAYNEPEGSPSSLPSGASLCAETAFTCANDCESGTGGNC
jgi:hypothetical protein